MKFENIPKAKEPEPKKPELTQEEFNSQCIEEANKLKTSVEALQGDIEKYGGIQKFKADFEEKTSTGNVAGDELSALSYREANFKKDAKRHAIWTTVIALGTVLTELGIVEGINAQDPTINPIIPVVLWAIIGGSLTINKFSDAIRARADARKMGREKKVNELKFKMADVTPIDKFKS